MALTTTSWDEFRLGLPVWAKDTRINLGSILESDQLDEQSVVGSVLAAALATRQPAVIAAARALAAETLDEEQLETTEAAVRTAVELMAMNNVYYRFVHLASESEYGRLPARLRMQGIRQHGAREVDFELWSLVVSVINGCGMCIDAHEAKLRKAGLPAAAIQDGVRIAAVIHAAAQVDAIS